MLVCSYDRGYCCYGNVIIGGNFCLSDINECLIGMDSCDVHAVCINTVSSFSCACWSGYTGDGVTCNGK